MGITNHSKAPLRVATMAGFVMSAVSLLTAVGYLVAKLIFWDWLNAGVAPILISLFFFSSVQLFFLGMLGEYIGAILTQVQKRPLVVERERVNFEPRDEEDKGVCPSSPDSRVRSPGALLQSPEAGSNAGRGTGPLEPLGRLQ